MKTLSITQSFTKKGTVSRWLSAAAVLLFGATALYTIIVEPASLMVAGAAGIFTIVGWAAYNGVKKTSAGITSATTTVAHTGLVLAGIALAPLLLFALLWTALLLIIGGAWLLHLVGLA